MSAPAAQVAQGGVKPLDALILAIVQVGKVVLTAMLLAAGGLSYLARLKRQNLVRQAHGMRSVDGITWQEFELLVGEAFRLKGYSVKELGGSGPDGGVDLVLTKNGETHLVQCKQWRSLSVGVDVVRQIFGVMAATGATGSFVVTSGAFTAAAKEFAHGRNVVLIDGPKLLEMIAQVRGKGSPPTTTPTPEVKEPTRSTPLYSPALSAPSCPSCNELMIKRIAKSGSQPFWGCASFPKCRGTRNM